MPTIEALPAASRVNGPLRGAMFARHANAQRGAARQGRRPPSLSTDECRSHQHYEKREETDNVFDGFNQKTNAGHKCLRTPLKFDMLRRSAVRRSPAVTRPPLAQCLARRIEEFPHSERLRQNPCSAESFRGFQVKLGVPVTAGHRNDGRQILRRMEIHDRLKSVLFRHQDVRDDEIERIGAQTMLRVTAVCRHFNGVAMRGQSGRENFSKQRLVLYN